MSWENLKDFENDYEIFAEYPYQIRKKSNQRIIKECIDKTNGYVKCRLNNKTYLKHRIIANQFIENPGNYECVDHINHVRTDNRVENLHWVSQKMNNNNKSNQIFVDEISDEAIVVDKYNDWDSWRIDICDKNGKIRSIYYNKFKRQYDLI